jgi:hypothetical protein
MSSWIEVKKPEDVLRTMVSKGLFFKRVTKKRFKREK